MALILRGKQTGTRGHAVTLGGKETLEGPVTKDRMVNKRHLVKKVQSDRYVLVQTIKLSIKINKTNILVIKCSGPIKSIV